jgi:hypothetical protein
LAINGGSQDASQATAIYQPTIHHNNAGVRDAIYFDGINDIMIGTMGTAVNNHTLIAMGKADPIAVGSVGFIGYSGDSSAGLHNSTLGYRVVAGSFYAWGGGANAAGPTGGPNFELFGSATQGGAYHGVIKTASSGTSIIYQDGLTGNSAAHALAVDSNSLLLGSHVIASQGVNQKMRLAEAMVVNAVIPSTTRNKIFRYLAMKYGVPLYGKALRPDDMTGGTGADTFVWTNASWSGLGPDNRDIIRDFSLSESDKIKIYALGGNLTFRSGGNGTSDFTGSKIQVAYKQLSNEFCSQTYGIDACTVVYVDDDGDNETEYEIELEGIINLTSGDFVEAVSDNLTNYLSFRLDAAKANSTNTAPYTNGCAGGDLTWYDTVSGKTGALTNYAACGATTGWTGDGSTANPYALTFDGVNDYVNFGTIMGYDINQDFSASVWIKNSNPA